MVRPLLGGCLMLDQWLAPSSLAQFSSEYLGRRPLARPATAKPFISCFDWTVLERVLWARPDVLIARDGRLVPVRAPRSVTESLALMRAGFGIVVREAERHDAALAELARAFGGDVPGEVHIQLYVTPAGTQTFGWHFDDEDVFIIQTLGAKDYRFRENTVTPDGPMGAHPDFGAVRRETSPLFAAELIAGDWLYIPSRWWHLVRSIEDSLSISIGVIPASRRHGAGAGLPSNQRQARHDLQQAEREEA